LFGGRLGVERIGAHRSVVEGKEGGQGVLE
jgi:hypothetical protein